MAFETPNIDPSETVCIHPADETVTGNQIRSVFDAIEDTFAAQLSHPITAQILQDVRTMADIRFQGLLDESRTVLQETVQKYEENQETPDTYPEASTSPLPGWELTIGINVNKGMLVSEQRVKKRAGGDTGLIESVMALSAERPIIDSAHAVALYHHKSHSLPVEQRDIACSYLTDELLSYDYCLLITADDVEYFFDDSITEIDKEQYRAVINEVLEQKLRTMQSARTPMQIKHLFEGYAKPLIIRVQDYYDIYDVKDGSDSPSQSGLD